MVRVNRFGRGGFRSKDGITNKEIDGQGHVDSKRKTLEDGFNVSPAVE